MTPDLDLNDIIEMRKPHPCGSTHWLIVRLGADIGLECRQCKRRILISRRELQKKMKLLIKVDQQSMNDNH